MFLSELEAWLIKQKKRIAHGLDASSTIKATKTAADMHPSHIDGYLAHLAVDRSVAIHTQRTALNALAFLFRKFLNQEIGQITFNKARKPAKLPTILSKKEAQAIIIQLDGLHRLIVQLMYGSGPAAC